MGCSASVNVASVIVEGDSISKVKPLGWKAPTREDAKWIKKRVLSGEAITLREIKALILKNTQIPTGAWFSCNDIPNSGSLRKIANDILLVFHQAYPDVKKRPCKKKLIEDWVSISDDYLNMLKKVFEEEDRLKALAEAQLQEGEEQE